MIAFSSCKTIWSASASVAIMCRRRQYLLLHVPKNPMTHLLVSLTKLLRVVLQNFAIFVRDKFGFFRSTLSTIFAFSRGCTRTGLGGDGVTGGVNSNGRLGGGVFGIFGGLVMSSAFLFLLSGTRNAAGTSACEILLSFAVILSIIFLNSARFV